MSEKSESLQSEPQVRLHKERGHQCPYGEYRVKRPEGLIVNERLYSGMVNVPSCLISILCEQDQNWAMSEVHLMSNKGRSMIVDSYKE